MNVRVLAKKIPLLLCVAAFVAIAVLRYSSAPASGDGYAVVAGQYCEKSYAAYLAANLWNGSLAATAFTVESAGEDLSWNFACTQAGFYNVQLEYMPLPGSGTQIEYSLLLNGEIPYEGMKQLVFNRCYDNLGGEKSIRRVNNNEIRQRSSELFRWSTTYLSDSQKRDSAPYLLYLSEGRHSLRLLPLRGAMQVRYVQFCAAAPILPFAETQIAAAAYSGTPLTFQAERLEGGTTAVLKSSPSIRNEIDYTSVDTVPYHPWQTRLNVIGGSSWRAPGETITWEIELDEAGLYGLSFRAAQSSNRGVTSFRRLYINGETPCAEALALGFGFSPKYRHYDFSARSLSGLLFYFNKGSNTITLENVLGEFATPLSVVEESLAALNDLYRRIVRVTGLVPDRYLDYEIDAKVSGFREILADQSAVLYGVVDTLVAINNEKNIRTAMLETMALQAARLAKNPERVVPELASFKGNISALGDWIISISEMPLYIDSFTLYAPAVPDGTALSYSPKESGFFVKAWNGLLRFLATFFVDERKLGESGTVRNALTVWVPTGRDQAIIIKNMVDDSFVPLYDIPVEIQLIPLDVVLPAALAGSGPDIALDMPQANVLNFAMRNALADLSAFSDYADIAAQFYPSGINAASFLGGAYGIPERQIFPMLYARNDILAELGIAPPETWDEFKKAVAKLNVRNYDAYVPTQGMSVYFSMLFQKGGDLYEGTGNDYGIATGLYSRAAMEAFADYVSFYTAYKLPVAADFANRFRTGEMPLGIFDYTLYNTLELFAPEIRGLWSFRPIPGVLNEMEMKNTVLAAAYYSVILNNCTDKEAAWKFIKWWLSTEIQTEYSLQLESVLGAAGRHSTANSEVLRRLPWSPNAAGALLAQFENTVGVPDIPGGYMSARMVDYAFRSVVTGSNAMRPRQALYVNLPAIDRELTRKRTEFHLTVKGNAVEPGQP